MNALVRNILAVLLGVVIGGVANFGLILVGPMIIPAPPGVDVTNMDSIAASLDLFQPRHFLFPFLAHALGTLIGAIVAYLVAGSHKKIFAYVIGGLFLVGGIAAANMIPAPLWFLVLDLVIAYIPMASLACWLTTKFTIGQQAEI